jgi:outer membrane protein OmpA-like peptidoglycan-associated protein
MTVGGQTVQVPAIELTGKFGNKRKMASGQFYVLDNRNNPALLSYTLQFKGEKSPRTERVVLVTPGAGERSAMEQSLATVREYTTRGIHFNFDDATIRSSSNQLLEQIAVTMQNNPLWTLLITGHTDSIGKAGYNEELSLRRAESVKQALMMRGVAPVRLATAGAGASQPIASNETLEGRALNRRVVLTRTDR